MRSAASGRPGSSAKGAGRRPPRSTPPAQRSGLLGMLAFAAVFWLLIESQRRAGAFAAASLAWLGRLDRVLVRKTQGCDVPDPPAATK